VTTPDLLMKRLLILALATAALPPIACAQHSNAGAHQMGDKWMPCATHSDTKTNAH